jgi:hypothetical protein
VKARECEVTRKGRGTLDAQAFGLQPDTVGYAPCKRPQHDLSPQHVLELRSDHFIVPIQVDQSGDDKSSHNQQDHKNAEDDANLSPSHRFHRIVLGSEKPGSGSEILLAFIGLDYPSFLQDSFLYIVFELYTEIS